MPALGLMDFAPTHLYEPNDAETTLCKVDNDFWEFHVAGQVFVRHHRRPRTQLFLPDTTGPDLDMLAPERVTVASCLPQPLVDNWSAAGAPCLQLSWVGATFFFVKGKFTASDFLDSSYVKAVQRQVHVRLQDGTEQVVQPHQLKEVSAKKIHQFDLDNVRPPELPSSKRRGKFFIPPGEFGSEVAATQPDTTFGANASSRSTDRAMEPHRAADRGDLRLDRQGDLLQQDAAGLFAPVPRADGLRQSLGQHEDDMDASDYASEDDFGHGADAGGDHGISTRPSAMCSSGGHVPPHGQCPREVHGVHPVREGLEGPQAGLPRPDRQRDGARVQARAWPTSCSRRRHRQEDGSHTRHRPRLIGQLLLLLGALFGTNAFDQQYGGSLGFDADFQDETFDGAYGNQGIGNEDGGIAHPGDRRHRPGVRASVDGGDDANVGGRLVKPSKGAIRRMQTSARQALASAKLTKDVIATHARGKR